MHSFLLLLLLGTAAAAAPCTTSPMLPGGWSLPARAGVSMHYRLDGGNVTIALQADTSEYVEVGFAAPGQTAMVPSDTVVATESHVLAYQQNGYHPASYVESDVELYDTGSWIDGGGRRTAMFTRALASGRFPINVTGATVSLAYGAGAWPGSPPVRNETFTVNLAACSLPAPPPSAATQPPPFSMPPAVPRHTSGAALAALPAPLLAFLLLMAA